ncbi:MAG TPA: ROK family transcriptional regulator [Candidatus Sulfopaludibacter sp.]|jgi:predicted NBD/HSP70 family sugar kinase|nr:ROK family transcriptional regulator [Candidatus Sulfopaludibacter sp.]
MIDQTQVTAPKRIQGASSEFVRDINRRIILNLVRTRHPISRADLARLSGLQRSTVSLIVGQLIEEHWVLEGPTGRLPRGRRPTFLRLNDERVIIGVDVRPTQTTVAVADANGRFLSQEIMATSADPANLMTSLIQSIERLIGGSRKKKIEGVGISLPGRYNDQTDRLVFAPNLKWQDVDIRTPIAKATGLDVTVENAANACVLAAVWFDHMEDVRNLVVVTISEGIGTGVWANGQLVRGLNGMAGEFGHVPLDPNGPACGCGGHGCWEVFGSNRAALRYYRENGAEPGDMTFLDLLARADQGDQRAVKALETMARYVGRGTRMVVAGLAPERIVMVGDLTRSWHRFGPVIEAEVRSQVLPGGGVPQVIPAYEDGMARLRGTVALVLQKDFGTLSDIPA